MNTDRPLIIIGGQKCGTTTLLHDLEHCKAIRVRLDQKEASPMLFNNWTDRQGSRARKWLNQTEDQKLPVDVSTRYSMRDNVTVPTARVAKDYPNARIVYLVRHPLERAISHHTHNTVLGLTTESAETAIHLASEYTANSLYGTQLQPWAEHFPPDQIMIIKFENYISDRKRTILDICNFAGCDSDGLENIDEQRTYNVTKTRVRYHPLVSSLQRTSFYRHWVKLLLGKRLRTKLKGISEVENNVNKSELSIFKRNLLLDVFMADHKLLCHLHPDAPSWDLSKEDESVQSINSGTL